ncbi:MAG: protein translocase subunit SecDF [Bacteroidaceae bacterium]|nr:protein translocase subunit SecDF [Bacteroidaceae bacterium]
MQNKPIVLVFATLLTLVCLFYLSFSFVTRSYENRAAEMGDSLGTAYLDSLANEKVYLGTYTLRQCQENQIGLGLDLKGGMNVILEVSVPDVVKSLADNNTNEAFEKAIAQASTETAEGGDFISEFVRAYKANGGNKLAEIFATQKLKGRVNTNSTDSEVESVLRGSVDDAIDNSFNILRTRIDGLGVVQPNIQKLESSLGRIMVEMPGIKDPARVRKLLQGSANLEFWETYDSSDAIPYLQQLASQLMANSTTASQQEETPAEEEVAAADSTSAAEALESLKVEEKKAAPAPAEAVINPLPMQFGGSGCVVGIAHYRDTATVNRALASQEAKTIIPKDMSLKWGVKAFDQKGQYFELYAIKVTSRTGKAPLEGDVITEAKDDFERGFGNRPIVSMSMNSEGARLWANLTKNNIGHAVAIVLDNYVYSAPNVQTEISGGNSQISGNFTAEDTKDLANVLKSGRMPAPAKIVQEDIVGPSLGQESINQGIMSFIVAFILLMIYMCAMYGVIPGMVANCALIVNFFFTLGILTSFQAALTMSGIAGMVLSLGMAVDANVLIYERTKEELSNGKPLNEAVGLGYSNALSAIFDSNLTSIITGIILFYFGTGPIRGFATTLIVGIICSFFTAVFLTRIVYEHFIYKDKWQNLTFVTGLSKNLMKGTNFNFMGNAKKSFTIFGALLVIAFGSLAIRGLSKSIDFTGGRNMVVQFENTVSPEEVRALLNAKIDALSQESGEAVSLSCIALGNDGHTVRVSTNYLIHDESREADNKIEEFLYNTFKEGKLLGEGVSIDQFRDYDNRAGGSLISSQKVGPSIAEDITYGAIISVILALAAIFIYILVRFRNVAYSVGSTIALTSDTLLIIGAYSICYGWMPFSLDIDQTFIGAILTAIGYSINDKVVIFDRIREFFTLYPKRDRQDLFNQSLNSTLARTINTSVSTLVVLLCIFILGGDSIRSFAFAMILGVIIGTCSSLFIAAPVAYITMGRRIKDADAVEEVPAK